jgi:hypothetical protein
LTSKEAAAARANPVAKAAGSRRNPGRGFGSTTSLGGSAPTTASSRSVSRASSNGYELTATSGATASAASWASSKSRPRATAASLKA